MTSDQALEVVRRICLGLPETGERLSHGSPCFFFREKKSFLYFHDDHHGDGRLAIWCAAPEGAQDFLVHGAPDRYFVPPYVGHHGWIGLRLDGDATEDEIAGVIEDAYVTRTGRR